VLTSPPYWDMLRAKGAGTQKQRRTSAELDVFLLDDPNDLGNLGITRNSWRALCNLPEAETTTAPESLPDHHREECEKRRKDLSAGLGPGAGTWEGIYAEGRKIVVFTTRAKNLDAKRA